jgi:hypothetical protein
MNWQDEQHVALLRKAYGRELDTLTVRQDAALQRFVRDVFCAGHTEGEKARRAAPANPRPGVVSRRRRLYWLAIEVLASITTIAGMWEGSSTFRGASWYLASTLVWIWLMFERRLWGIAPLNALALVVEILVLTKVTHG